MSIIKKKLQEEYEESFDSVNDVEELILDNLGKFKELSKEDKTFLETFESLKFLSMAGLGLQRLANFPALPELVMLDLSGNKLAGGLESLENCKNLQKLDLQNNLVDKVAALKPLGALNRLNRLLLAGCPIAKSKSYRKDVYDTLQNLVVLDGKDKEEREVFEDESEVDEELEEHEGDIEAASEESLDEEEEEKRGLKKGKRALPKDILEGRLVGDSEGEELEENEAVVLEDGEEEEEEEEPSEDIEEPELKIKKKE